mmetsp:Transcript_5464/g.12910  ORF Transcript_5464/g.12910 Transcript_5464/m.12910 type:complete len:211 (+) Transcript_5464:71-703(+)
MNPFQGEYLSWILFVAVVCIGAGLPSDRPVKPHHTYLILADDDGMIRGVGTLLPLPIILLRICLSAKGCQYQELEKVYAQEELLCYGGISALRIALFLATCEYHYYFSEHIVLASALVAILSLEFVLLRAAPCRRGAWLMYGLVWALLLAVLVEVYETAFHYHTRQATFLALCVGVLLFGSIGRYFRRKVEQAEKEKHERCERLEGYNRI